MTAIQTPAAILWDKLPHVLLCAVLVSLLHAAGAQAHRMHVAMTTVLFNDRTERIEVMHRFFLHDAEQAVTQIFGPNASLLDSIEDRQRFAIYVHERFLLQDVRKAKDAKASRLPLVLKGSEVEGEFIWVYQALAYQQPRLDGLIIMDTTLRELWPDQVNTVNVERDGKVQTVRFSHASSGRQLVSFR